MLLFWMVVEFETIWLFRLFTCPVMLMIIVWDWSSATGYAIYLVSFRRGHRHQRPSIPFVFTAGNNINWISNELSSLTSRRVVSPPLLRYSNDVAFIIWTHLIPDNHGHAGRKLTSAGSSSDFALSIQNNKKSQQNEKNIQEPVPWIDHSTETGITNTENGQLDEVSIEYNYNIEVVY